MKLELTRKHMEAVNAHGAETYPNECCGFLLGNTNGDTKRIESTIPIGNARDEENQHNRYLITPELYMQTERDARKDGLDILGFYHSHPDVEARPSVYDLDHAWPWVSYLIVSVCEGEAKEAYSWILADDRSRFDAEELILL